jgi:hypothetical protein
MLRVLSDEEAQVFRVMFRKYLDDPEFIQESCRLSDITDDNLEMLISGMVYQYNHHRETLAWVQANVPERQDWIDQERRAVREYGAILKTIRTVVGGSSPFVSSTPFTPKGLSLPRPLASQGGEKHVLSKMFEQPNRLFLDEVF